MGVCVIGVIILVQPYGENEMEKANNTLGSILILMNAFLNAVNFCLLRMMRSIHYCISPFYYGMLGSIVSLAFIVHSAALTMGQPMRIGWVDLVIFFIIGLSSAAGAILKSLAFHYEKVTTLSLIKYTNLIYSLLADVLLFDSHIYFGEIIGASLILSSNAVIALLKIF